MLPVPDDAQLAATLAGILGDLIALPSTYPPGDTGAICAYAMNRLAGAGYETDQHTKVAPIANGVARLGTGRPNVVFNVHADTVGVGDPGDWATDPFKAEIRDGRLHGIGASNCKGAMAVHLWLAEEIARRGGPRTGQVTFTFVGDEECIGPNGTAYLRQAGLVKPDILIVGATTDNQLITAERGVMWVRITTRGTAAHGGDPAAGDNAVERMMRLLAPLVGDLFPALARRRDGDMVASANIGVFQGGQNTNVVPSECVVEIDRRLLPAETVTGAFDEISGVLENAGEPAGGYQVLLLRGTNGFKAPKDGPGVGALAAAIEARTGAPARFLTTVGAYDGRYFADDGIEIVNVGPGTEGHEANESVPVSKLADAAVIHLDAVDRLLGLG